MLSKRMQELSPYVAGEQPRDRQYIKLNTNENPYPPTRKVAEKLRNFNCEKLKLYPDPRMTRFRQVIAEREGVAEEWVFAGNGSDEVLAFCFYAFFDSVLFPELTYSFYPVYCDFYSIPYSTVPVKADLSIDLESFLQHKEPVILSNPNSPTGMYIEPAEIRSFLDRCDPDRVVVIDEAYIDFGGESCAAFLQSFSNLVVVRTLSKSHSLAGLRLGYALASPELINALFTVKDSFNSYPVHTLAQELGVEALLDSDANLKNRQRIMENRSWTAESLSEMGFKVLPSMANFIFCSLPGRNGSWIYQELKKRGILVRYFDREKLKAFVRISIGTRSEMQTLLGAVKELIGEVT